ncbi:MAG: DUF935 domain-containing protein, partial [Pseudomonadota bacterium]
PVKPAELTREHGEPSLFGIRRAWHDSVASGLTPSGLANILTNAAQGNGYDFLTLCEEMEERDLHYGGVLNVRKLAVSGLPAVVESATDDAADVALADEIRELVRAPEFGDLVADSLDALGKGFAATEIIWDRSAKQWWPSRYEHRDPRFFTWDQATGRELRLLDEADPVWGVPLAPFKWVRHFPRLRTGLPVRGGIARVVAWAHMFKSYSIKDWMAFAEVFGMPLRVGKYGSEAGPSDIAILKTAVANLGMDAACVIPESMKIEFEEAANSRGGETLFQTLADWLDNQVTKYILGQTGTTSGTPGKLGNEESQNEVRHDIRDNDLGQLCRTINRDLVRPYIDLNHGPQDNYPRIILQPPKTEDLDRLSLALNRLVPMGLKVEQSEIRDRFGLSDPAKDAEILVPLQMGNPPPDQGQAPNRVARALNRSGAKFTPDQQALEDFGDLLLELGAKVLAGNEEKILEAVQDAETWDEAMAAVVDLYPEMDMEGLRDLTERAAMNANLFGRATAREEE